ncbi:MAG: YraN family protein [Bacteroidaceae bacterium]|nr:YraN family protein [Bacteroidaceae bacterium]
MAQHNEFGQISEDRAVAYLMAHGYTIRDRNWRIGHKEIDIVAQKNGELVIIEVKARKNDHFGDPADAVTDDKIRKLVQAANAYVRYHRISWPVRFDIIAITGEPGYQKVEHIEDAFYPPLY